MLLLLLEKALPPTLPSGAHTNSAIIIKYDPSGTMLWARRFLGDASIGANNRSYGDHISSIKTDSLGDIYLSGEHKNIWTRLEDFFQLVQSLCLLQNFLAMDP